MTKSALILIDLQNDYFPDFPEPKMALPNTNPATDNAAALLADARAKGAPLFHIRHVMASDAAPFFHPGTEGADTHPKVAPLDGEPIIGKTRPSAFYGTDLEARLRDQGITDVTLCGAMSQMCVNGTARAASGMGFNVTVVEDACAAANVAYNGVDVLAEQVHAAIMAPLSSSFGSVVATSDDL
ncbi:cysteine hydrolase family protein [uncultured Tateyamaria sp.]|uniref:cysteine hydrolase family protein n=1 Tax=uncultured Tateyamaria sp. TaxID=455651 RepID=UPI002631ECF4|nr:cysteine hydrolase family protein [uncultured Tateyamaria sp.]